MVLAILGILFRSKKKYRTSELRVPVVVQPQINDATAAAALTTFGDVQMCLDIFAGLWQMPQESPRLGSS
jgi:hypothetical protein